MSVFVGKTAPDFTAKAIMPNNNIDDKFKLSDYAAGNNIVLFFIPRFYFLFVHRKL